MHAIRTWAAVAALPLVAASLGAQERESWSWNGSLAEGRTVYLYNMNGAVNFEVGSGDRVEVRAEKRWRRGDPDDVRIEARMAGSGNGDVLVCAMWNPNARCELDGVEGPRNDRRWSDRNDVSVEFTVTVPRYARITTNTVNGSVRIDEVAGDIEAGTVNGSVTARSTSGRVRANTVNGSITVGGQIRSEDVEYSTVNGSVTLELPADVNCEVDLSTVNGRISTDFPITVDGTINPRRIRARIGNGGPTIRARTVNGAIRIRRQ